MIDVLTVLIATSNDPKEVALTLGSIAACNRPSNFDRVVLVENGRAKGIREMLKSLHLESLVEYFHIPRANKSMALNKGLRLIRSGLVVFLDDDVRCDPNLLKAYLRVASDRAWGNYYGGVVVPINRFHRPKAHFQKYFSKSVIGHESDDWHESDTTYFFGANWAARAEDILSIKGFDPAFGPGSRPFASGQETVMQARLALNGFRKVFVPQAVVGHVISKHKLTLRSALRKVCSQGTSSAFLAGSVRSSVRIALDSLRVNSTKLLYEAGTTRSTTEMLDKVFNLAHAYGILTGSCYRLWNPHHSIHSCELHKAVFGVDKCRSDRY